MRPVLLVIAAALSVTLYKLLSRGGKTYTYARTQTISFLSDGSEHVIQGMETGSIIIAAKTVMIDGQEFLYKPAEGQQPQAFLEFDENGLRSVRVLLHEGGEKQYFIDKNPAAVKTA